MTNTPWTTTVSTIAPIFNTLFTVFITPLWAGWILSRKNQPTKNPENTQENKRSQRTAPLWKRLLISEWFMPSIPVVIGILELLHSFHTASAIVTLRFVVYVAFSFAQITYGITMYFIILLLKMIRLHCEDTDMVEEGLQAQVNLLAKAMFGSKY